MNGREKILNALNHQEGPVPMDFGGGPTTGIHCSVVESLRKYYGLENRPVTIIEPFQMLGLIEEDLLDAMGVDTIPFWNPYTMFGYKNDGWKEWNTPWGQAVLVGRNFTTTRNENGDVFIYPEGDLSVPPSGKMPRNGYFFDSIIRQEPIDDENLDPKDNLEEFGEIDSEVIDDLRAAAGNVRDSGRAVFANFGGTAIGDIALVPGPQLKHPKGIRDVTEWYISTVTRQDYLRKVFDREVDIGLTNLDKINRAVGDAVDIVYICGTDFGTQTSTFCSTETYEELYAPYYKRINDWIHGNTSWKTFKHSCGAVAEFIPRFIESGFDIINPVQLSAAGMDGRVLKEKYGDKITFWGGGVDTQKTLPFGTPEEVTREVTERCELFASGGGFVFNTIHNVQAKTPVENVVAMIDAVKDFNRRRR
ncbi:MAG: uroporphyrinogen decarboxylase family protein [Spirochaetia bacterium]